MKMDIRCSCEKGFSIRGYVASKRGSTPDVSSIYPLGRELPLMEVPSFRYWRCRSCGGIEEDATVGAPEDNIVDVQYLAALEQTTISAAIEVPADEHNAGAIDLMHQSEEIHKTKRKYRSLADIIGVKQSPRRKRAANQQEEVSIQKASKRDKGKAKVTNGEDADTRLVQSTREGLFIGSKEERQRNRTAPSRKKTKHGLSENVVELIRELPSPPTAANLKLPCLYQNEAGLSSEGLRLCMDLSLSTSPRRSRHQNSGPKGDKNDTQNEGSNQGNHLQCDVSSKMGSLDLNVAIAHTSAIPFQKNMDFLQLGPKEKTLDKENQKEPVPRTYDDIFKLLAKQQFQSTNSDVGHSPIAHGSSNSAQGFWNVGAQVTFVPNSKANPLSLSQSRSSLPTLESLGNTLTNSLPPHNVSQPISTTTPAIGLRFGGQPKKDRQQHRGKTISDIKDGEQKTKD